MSDFEKFSFLYGNNAIFIEELYLKYLEDPSSVDQSWQDYFAKEKDSGLKMGASWGSRANVVATGGGLELDAREQNSTKSEIDIHQITAEYKIRSFVSAYRERGHMAANLDPLGLEKGYSKDILGLAAQDFGLKDGEVNLGGEFFASHSCSVGKLVSMLDKTYCGNIAVEFSHLVEEEKSWLYRLLEEYAISKPLTKEEQKELLKDLVEIEGFEQYLHVKFPGAKRFSIEGVDSAIISILQAVEFAADNNLSDVVIGMAHRGRLSSLAKVLGKPYRAIISEFMGVSSFPEDLGISGDVKYHMGYSNDIKSKKSGKKIHLSLTPNPSHLEAVNPVAVGKTRAKQDVAGDVHRKQAMTILIHGDASFSGQGVVAESLAMSPLENYSVGGVLHIVINNQIGFTTDPTDSRSGRYATEMAKIISAPIIHVNADDAEAVSFVTSLASEYRHKFHKDIVIDIIGYRKYGHNEGDEPMYTQSIMYNVIKSKKSAAAIYAACLESIGVVVTGEYESMKADFKKFLDKEYEAAAAYKPSPQVFEGLWTGFKRPSDVNVSNNTGVEVKRLLEIGKNLCKYPVDFEINPKLAKILENREKHLEGSVVDWAMAEALAFASLLSENIPVRISGQDAQRGTFSHRHGVLHDQKTGSRYVPFDNISPGTAKFELVNSNLSEFAVLGFEYGYSSVNPNHLVIWEAQFGDFANGAQIIWDQFISSAETKWLRMSGLVCLLPHGYEGQGPEHSSARLERFLQLCAEDNMQVVNPTTPASLFHVLRRQIHRDFRKPLIIMSPKSLLRHKMVISDITDFGDGTRFLPMLDDKSHKNARRVVICSGKVYYDLLEERLAKNLDVAIVRVEQYYPFDKAYFTSIISEYKNAEEFVWCQEEPKNMGAWSFIKDYIEDVVGKGLICVARPASASTAVGYAKVSEGQQSKLVKQALGVK